MIVPFAVWVYRQNYSAALIIFFVAGLSDGVDGFLARQFNWKSRFGAIADPLADKLLLTTAYVVLAMTSQLPVWLAFVVLGRDLLIFAGALVYHYGIGRYEIKPSIWGKACTLFQIVYVLAVMMKLAELPMPDWVITYGLWWVLGVTVVSGCHYTVVWTRKGLKELKARKP